MADIRADKKPPTTQPPKNPPPPGGPKTNPPPGGPKTKEAKAADTGRRPLGTAEEVSDYLGVPVATLHQWRHKGTGPRASKVGRWLRYRWDDVEKWLDEQAKAA